MRASSWVTLFIVLSCRVSSSSQYEYFYMQDSQFCSNRTLTITVDDSRPSGYIFATNQTYYQPHKDCQFKLRASDGYKLTIRFQKIDIYSSSNYACNEDYLQVIGETDQKKYCGSLLPGTSLYSSADYLSFQFHSGHTPLDQWQGFKLYYTRFHTGSCYSDEFRCRIQKRCIPQELACDNHDNCGDWSDERYCNGMSEGAAIALITCFCVVLFCLIIIMSIIICKKVSERREAKRRRTSRNSSIAPAPMPTANTYEPPPSYYNAVFFSSTTTDGDNPPTYDVINDASEHNQSQNIVTVAMRN